MKWLLLSEGHATSNDGGNSRPQNWLSKWRELLREFAHTGENLWEGGGRSSRLILERISKSPKKTPSGFFTEGKTNSWSLCRQERACFYSKGHKVLPEQSQERGMQMECRHEWTSGPQGSLPSWGRRNGALLSQRRSSCLRKARCPSVPDHMHTGFERPSLRWALSPFPHPALLFCSWDPPATRSHCEDGAQKWQGLGEAWTFLFRTHQTEVPEGDKHLAMAEFSFPPTY